MASLAESLCINDVLSQHLLVEVLIRIPVRDAFRCRSVCKLWLLCLRDDDPSFIGLFILQRTREHRPSDEADRQVMHLQCHPRENMLLVHPTWNIPNGFQVSFDFLPLFAGGIQSSRRVTVLSSNGLFLCSPDDDDAFPFVNYVCNPLTKQWLALPPPPKCSVIDFEAGFICDPFYRIKDGGHSISLNSEGFGFKVVILHLFNVDYDEGYDDNDNADYPYLDPQPLEVDVEIFSSRTGCWTASTVQLPSRVYVEAYCSRVVPHDDKLYWLYEPCNTLVYNPQNDEFLLQHHCIPPALSYNFDSIGQATFTGLSICQGSLWLGQTSDAHLRAFILAEDGEWSLKHDVHMLDDMYCNSSSVKDKISRRPDDFEFWTMHPCDPMVAYLSVEDAFLECDFRCRSLVLVADDYPPQGICRSGDWRCNVLTYSLPLWPTPLPVLPTSQ